MKLGSGCDTVGRAVAFATRRRRFKSRQQNFLYKKFANCQKDENREKGPLMVCIGKQNFLFISSQLYSLFNLLQSSQCLFFCVESGANASSEFRQRSRHGSPCFRPPQLVGKSRIGPNLRREFSKNFSGSAHLFFSDWHVRWKVRP